MFQVLTPAIPTDFEDERERVSTWRVAQLRESSPLNEAAAEFQHELTSQAIVRNRTHTRAILKKIKMWGRDRESSG